MTQNLNRSLANLPVDNIIDACDRCVKQIEENRHTGVEEAVKEIMEKNNNSKNWFFKPLPITYEEAWESFNGSMDYQSITKFRHRNQQDTAVSLSQFARAAKSAGEATIMVSREDFEYIQSFWKD